jgi:D-beta-D-heptose 7-phosphate kinase/D-beta-D-heptose 1-phosphate adenosyltransferase
MGPTAAIEQKILELPELLEQLAPRRAAGQRLVLTNGCFELLHRGHVRYLNAAAALGDVLVVGVNSDASVRRLKGRGRALVPADERAEVVAALACVDYATIFDAPTAEGLVDALRPDLYVKGGDYAAHPPPEAARALALGGEFRLIELVPGNSTSALVERIRRTAHR